MSTKNSHTLRQIVTVYNPYEFDLEYKVLSTAPALYSVQESVGRLKPQSLVDIVIRRNSPDDDSADISCVDKFRVQVRKVTKPLLIGHSDIVVFVNGTASGTAATAPAGSQALLDPAEEVPKAGPSSRRNATACRRSPTRIRSDQRSESFHWLLVAVGAVCILCLWTPYAEERMDAIPSWYPEWLRLTVPQKLVSAYVLGCLRPRRRIRFCVLSRVIHFHLDNRMSSQAINLFGDDPNLEMDPLHRRLFHALELSLKSVRRVTKDGTSMAPNSTVSSVRKAVKELHTSLVELFSSRKLQYYNELSKTK
ncbi:Motile Sperm domain containing protein [Trichuris trichiura]|uniref:Motile Sperm domain containing protein n=1 Tax=Trichuris trichiura TaxID=36087 RepID=A0A077YZC9_TRITR|nr:Motile Sperm domain containing protein [Trichuris trichiura]